MIVRNIKPLNLDALISMVRLGLVCVSVCVSDCVSDCVSVCVPVCVSVCVSVSVSVTNPDLVWCDLVKEVCGIVVGDI